jgi:hypothetical protein
MFSRAITSRQHQGIQGQLGEFFADLGHEIQRETHMDSSQSDMVVQRHVSGLVIAMFSLVAVLLLASIWVIAFFVRY